MNVTRILREFLVIAPASLGRHGRGTITDRGHRKAGHPAVRLVSEALAGATEALLANDVALGVTVVEGDQSVDDLTSEVELLVWPLLEVEAHPARRCAISLVSS